MNPSSYSPAKIIDIINKYSSSLDEFVLENGDEICNIKILDIRVPKGTSHLIDKQDINDILLDKNIQIIPAIVGNDEVPCVRNLLYFLGECSCRSAKDIIPYAESGHNPDECRGTATYEICNCPDVSRYQEAVARLMHSSVYNVAFNAMQGALRANLKDPVIINAYRWMKEYYKDNKTIQSNLERVDGL